MVFWWERPTVIHVRKQQFVINVSGIKLSANACVVFGITHITTKAEALKYSSPGGVDAKRKYIVTSETKALSSRDQPVSRRTVRRYRDSSSKTNTVVVPLRHRKETVRVKNDSLGPHFDWSE